MLPGAVQSSAMYCKYSLINSMIGFLVFNLINYLNIYQSVILNNV